MQVAGFTVLSLHRYDDQSQKISYRNFSLKPKINIKIKIESCASADTLPDRMSVHTSYRRGLNWGDYKNLHALLSEKLCENTLSKLAHSEMKIKKPRIKKIIKALIWMTVKSFVYESRKKEVLLVGNF